MTRSHPTLTPSHGDERSLEALSVISQWLDGLAAHPVVSKERPDKSASRMKRKAHGAQEP
jgi:hypothetical protein